MKMIMFTALAFGSISAVRGRSAGSFHEHQLVTEPTLHFLFRDRRARVLRMKTAGDLFVKRSRLSLQPWLS